MRNGQKGIEDGAVFFFPFFQCFRQFLGIDVQAGCQLFGGGLEKLIFGHGFFKIKNRCVFDESVKLVEFDFVPVADDLFQFGFEFAADQLSVGQATVTSSQR